MAAIFLSIFYSLLFAWLVKNWAFFARSGISSAWLLGLFMLKILAGLAYGCLHKYYFAGGDTFLFFAESQHLAATFAEYPSYCLQSLLGLNPELPAADAYVYPPASIFWKDLGTYFIIHINAALVPLSAGEYLVHIVFMSMLSLTAGLLLYKSFLPALQLGQKWLLVGCFLLPSLLFWTAGVHKDVFLLLGLGLFVHSLQFRRWGWLLLGLLIMGLTRHYSLILLLPALLAYGWAQRGGQWLLPKLLLSLSLAAAVLVCVDAFVLNDLIINILAKKQAAFIGEVGRSDVHNLQPFDRYLELLGQLPAALTNVMLRPFVWECDNVWQLLAALEMAIFWLFFALMVCFYKSNLSLSPLGWFMLLFALGYLLLIGFLVANEGTIVRYRAVPLSFLTVLIWQATDWVRLWSWWQKLSAFLLENQKFRTYP